MRKTNNIKRAGTCALILAGLGLTTPILSIAAEPAESNAAAPAIATLQLTPAVLDANIEAEINRRRFAVVDGSLPATAITKWKGMNSNHVRMNLTENGPRDVVIYDVEGDEVLGAEKKAALASLSPLFDLCASHAKLGGTTPDYYKMPSGSTGLVYNATCSPKGKPTDKGLTVDQEIAAVLADKDLSLDTREFRAYGMKVRQLVSEFEASTPNPTRPQYYDRCIYQAKILKEGYKPTNSPNFTQADTVAFCEKLTTNVIGPRAE